MYPSDETVVLATIEASAVARQQELYTARLECRRIQVWRCGSVVPGWAARPVREKDTLLWQLAEMTAPKKGEITKGSVL